MAKGGLSIRVSNKNHRNTPIFDFQPMVISKDGVNLMPCCLPFGLRFQLQASLSKLRPDKTTQQAGKAGGLQILRCQGFAVGLLRLHPWRLVSEALRLLQRWGFVISDIQNY